MSDHDEAIDRLGRANIDDARQRAERKVEDDAVGAREVVAEEARAAATALSGEVSDLRKEITVLQDIDHFKGKVYVVAVLAAAFSILSFFFLWQIANHTEDGVNAIRTDLEVHRIRNEASHDCIAEKMAKLPSPEQRAAGAEALTRDFVHEFLGCVADVAPTIVPPGAPDIRVTTNEERRGSE